MAVAVGNSASGSVNGNMLTWTHALITGSDIVLVVGLSLQAGIIAIDVTWDSGGQNEPLTFLRRDDNPGGGVTEIWYKKNPSVATGGSTIFAFLTAGMNQNIGGSVDFTGATTPDNATGSIPDSVSSVSDTVAGDAADNFIFDVIREPGAAPIAGADQTEQWNVAAGGERGGGSTQDGVDGGVMSWSNGTTDWAHTACRIPAAAAPPPSFPPRKRRPHTNLRM